jgi:hypothetical protein
MKIDIDLSGLNDLVRRLEDARAACKRPPRAR